MKTDLEDLRNEYESTYLNVWNKDNPLSFEQWLKKEKGIIIIKKGLSKIMKFDELGKKTGESKNLNISDVNVQSKYSVGDVVKIKENLDDIIGVPGMYLTKGPKHPLYKGNDNRGMKNFQGRTAKITYVVNSNHESNDEFDDKFSRYLIDIDNGDFWWVDECFD